MEIMWIILLLFVRLMVAQECPNYIQQCRCEYENNYIKLLRCANLGQLPQVPDFFNPSQQVIQTVLFGDEMQNRDTTTIGTVQSRAFSGLRLRILKLIDLQISSVEEQAFDGLGDHIESLHIDHNHISGLPETVFHGLRYLVYLQLDNNRLTSLNRNLFRDLADLTNLHLQQNQLTSLPPEIFYNLTGLERLYLDQNQLTSLPAGLLDHTRGLKLINLERNAIAQIEDTTFARVPDLERVELQRNRLTAIPANLFSANRYLLHFDVSFNQLQAIPLGLIKSVDVEYLNFGFNQIAEIHSSTFTLLRSLEYLYLRDNALSDLPDRAFENLIRLLVLDLQNNRIRELRHGHFLGLRLLRELHLQHNDIDTVGFDVFYYLSNIRAMDLSNNRIAGFQTSPFITCTRMEYLDLSTNQIGYIADDMFLFRVGGNDTNSVLKYLYLQRNNIRGIDVGTFRSLTELIALDLSENWITHLDSRTFARLTNLQTLKLSRNPLASLSDVFVGLSGLIELHLNNSCFQNVPLDFGNHMTSLEKLFIRDNSLGTAGSHLFTSMASLRLLDLRFCDIELVEETSFSSSLSQVFLSQNPLVCNCSNVWLRTQARKLVRPEDLVCPETSNNMAGYYTMCYPQDTCSRLASSDATANNLCSSSLMPPSGSILPPDDNEVFVDETVCDLSKYPGLIPTSTPVPTPPSNIITQLYFWREDSMIVLLWEVDELFAERISYYSVNFAANDPAVTSFDMTSQTNSTSVSMERLEVEMYRVCISAVFETGLRFNDLLCVMLDTRDFSTTIVLTTTQSNSTNTTVETLSAVDNTKTQTGSSDYITIIVASVGGIVFIIVVVLVGYCVYSCVTPSKKSGKEGMPTSQYSSFDDLDLGCNKNEQLVEQSIIYSSFDRNTMTVKPSGVHQNGSINHI